MAAFTPRGSEVNAIIAVLTDATFENETAMAKALLRTAFEQLMARDWWTVGVSPGESGKILAFYGLGGSEAALSKDMTETLEVGGRAMMVPIFSLAQLKERRRLLEDEWGKSELCGRCRHRASQHGFQNHKGGRVKTPANVAPCSIKCTCARFIPAREWKEMEKAEAARIKEMRELAEAMEEEAYGDGGAVAVTAPDDDDDLGGFEPPPDYYAA